MRLSIYCTQIRPKSRRYFFSYRDKSDVLVIWRVNRENSASIHLSNSSSVIFIIPLFGVSFSESRKSKLREKLGKSCSILKQKLSALSVHASARPCSCVQVWREIVFSVSLLALNKLLSRLTNIIVLRFVVFLL